MNNLQTPAKPVELNRILLESLQEIIGQWDLHDILQAMKVSDLMQDGEIILDRTFQAPEWEALITGLKSRYGLGGAYGITIRAGQVFFSDLYRCFGDSTNLLDRDFRMLPKPRRILRGLEILAELHNQYLSGFTVKISQDEAHWYWQMVEHASGRADSEVILFLQKFISGVIQEFLSWTSGGKFYPLQQSDKQSAGSGSLVIQINKKYVS